MSIIQTRKVGINGIFGSFKRLFLFLSALLFSFSFLGCSKEEYDYLETAFYYQVPFSGLYQQWNEYELVDQDQFGRKLFYCSTIDDPDPRVLSDFSNGKGYSVNFYFICKPNKDKTVSFCDAVCYLLVPDMETVKEEDIADLKQRNCWGKEPSLEQTTIPVASLSRWPLLKNEIWEAFKEQVETEAVDYYVHYLKTGDKGFYILREVMNEESPKNYGKTYLFLITEERVVEELTEISHKPADWQVQIRSFVDNIR